MEIVLLFVLSGTYFGVSWNKNIFNKIITISIIFHLFINFDSNYTESDFETEK